MSPLVEQDNYGLVAKKILSAPNLKRAYFTAPDKNQITLEFDQPMAWKDACKTWLELDRVPAPINTGKAAGNLINLKLSAPATAAKSIGYVSGKFWDGHQDKLIYGTNGIAALSFTAVPIEPESAKP